MVVGEGPHDVGAPWWDKNARELKVAPGWLQGLISRLADNIEITAIRREELPLSTRDLKRHRPLPGGHGARALLAKLKARAEGYDIVIFMADADTKDDKAWFGKRELVLDGFSRVDGPPGVACMPKSASESWLMADFASWEILGLPDEHLLPKAPEEIWGEKSDPNSDRPHNLFARICVAAGVDDSRETRASLSGTASLAEIAARCPISFVAFRADLEAAIGEG